MELCVPLLVVNGLLGTDGCLVIPGINQSINQVTVRPAFSFPFLSFPPHLAQFSSYNEAANRQPTNIFLLIGHSQVRAIGSKPIGQRTRPRAVCVQSVRCDQVIKPLEAQAQYDLLHTVSTVSDTNMCWQSSRQLQQAKAKTPPSSNKGEAIIVSGYGIESLHTQST